MKLPVYRVLLYRGYHDHFDHGIELAQLFQRLDPGHPRHDYIEKHHFGPQLREGFQSARPVLSLANDLMAFVFQDNLYQASGFGAVVHYKHFH